MKKEELPGKVVVFDMDETLGYFIQYSILWESLKTYFNTHNIIFDFNSENFNKILNLYPEYIRPNIYIILKYLKTKIQKKECQGVMIYTNNSGTKEWVSNIKNFFEDKIKYKLFNHIIYAFKVNGKHFEMCRTSHDKSLKDFIKCTKLPENTQICFLDDIFHPKMNYDNVYYIKLKSYTHDLPFEEILTRFLNSHIGKQYIHHENKDEFMNSMLIHMNKYNYLFIRKTPEENELDKIITKKTMYYLQNFFHNKDYNSNRQQIQIPELPDRPIYHSSKSRKQKKKYNANNYNKTFKKRRI